MERRAFLVRLGQTLVATPVLVQALGCSSDDENPTSPGGGGTDSFDTTSSSGAGHTHGVTFTCTALNAGTMSYTSTNNAGHTHTINLTGQQVTDILNEINVVVTTTDGGHTHNWSIQKPANVCP